MATYFILDLEVKDAKAFESYKGGVPPIIQKHGGEYLVRGGPVDVIELDGKGRSRDLAVLAEIAELAGFPAAAR